MVGVVGGWIECLAWVFARWLPSHCGSEDVVPQSQPAGGAGECVDVDWVGHSHECIPFHEEIAAGSQSDAVVAAGGCVQVVEQVDLAEAHPWHSL